MSTLEFVLILPMFLLLITFMVDISRVLMVSNAVGTATARAARDAAVRGGAYTICGSEYCYETAFAQALEDTPGSSQVSGAVTVDVTSGGQCSVGDPIVTLSATYDVTFLTPGLGAVLGTVGGFNGLSNVGVARCEVEFAN